jgi:hypothetical protein
MTFAERYLEDLRGLFLPRVPHDHRDTFLHLLDQFQTAVTDTETHVTLFVLTRIEEYLSNWTLARAFEHELTQTTLYNETKPGGCHPQTSLRVSSNETATNSNPGKAPAPTRRKGGSTSTSTAEPSPGGTSSVSSALPLPCGTAAPGCGPPARKPSPLIDHIAKARDRMRKSMKEIEDHYAKHANDETLDYPEFITRLMAGEDPPLPKLPKGNGA